MTGKQISRHMIICDGCGQTFGENGEYPTAAESRGAAANLGWRIIPKIRANGKPATQPSEPGRVFNSCDVCPTCVPSFHPPKVGRPSGKAWWKEEIDRLRAENEELRRR